MALTPQEARNAQEFVKRQSMALKLYRPLPHAEDLFRCRAGEILVRGGNRSTKSTSCAAYVAAFAMDEPITLESGEKIRVRPAHKSNEPVTIWLIGFDSKHIGQSLHRLLFRPGAFKIIRDRVTGEWRTWRPWEPDDDAREAEAKFAPPLIPASYIKPKSWGWENKAQKVFSEVTIRHPETDQHLATIYAYSSTGEVKAGDAVDIIWCDERVMWPDHYPEWQARLIDRNGTFLWSTWPDTTNRAIQSLTQRAKAEANNPEPLVKEFVWKTLSNKYLTKTAKARAISAFSHDPTIALARLEGEYADAELKSYPRFSRVLHSAIAYDEESDQLDKVSAILRKENGIPPRDWTKYLVLDPGTSHPAVLLLAVPPPTLGEYLIAYEEIYPGRADADQLAKIVANRTQGQWFQRFIVDGRAARQTPFGQRPVQATYADAFRKVGLSCEESGSTFIYGSDQTSDRILATTTMLSSHESKRTGVPGTTRFRVIVHKCPNLVEQLENTNKRQKNKGEIVEWEHAPGQKIDVLSCLEYGISRAVWFDTTHGRPVPQWYRAPDENRVSKQQSHLLDELDKLFHKTSGTKTAGGSLWCGPPRVKAHAI